MRVFPQQIHFSGACGRAIGSLALDLKRRGLAITASDGQIYPPMDKVLAEGGLKIRGEFSARNLKPGTDLVVAGGIIGPDNPEWKAAVRRGIPVMNMAAFLGKYFPPGQKRVVVAGTKGKTTTTAMLAWILKHAGTDPDWLLGGLSPHFELPVRFRGSRRLVLEGDEYPSGLADPLPKFRHYRPQVLVVTNLHFDHAEVFGSLGEIRNHFIEAARELPRNGLLLLGPDVEGWQKIAAASRAPVVRVGWNRGYDVVPTGFRATSTGMRFTFDGVDFELAQAGRMFAIDAMLAALAAARMGVPMEKSARALAEFQGVKGRLESLIDSERISLLVDESHHPAAIRKNIEALRLRHPGRRIGMVLQPRYTGGRGGFQEKELPQALADLDRLLLLRSFDLKVFPGGKFSSFRLAAALRRQGLEAAVLRRTKELPAALPRRVRAGDVWYLSLPPGCDFLTDPLVENLRKKFRP